MGCITVEYFAGGEFSDAIKDMRRLKDLLDCSIRSNMNGVEVYVMGNEMSVDEAVSGVRKCINTGYNFFIVN